MKFSTEIDVDPKDPNAYNIMSAFQRAMTMLVNMLAQTVDFGTNIQLGKISMTFSGVDRVASGLAPIEVLRVRMVVDSSRPIPRVPFYFMKPDNGDEDNWFVSTNGKDADSPGEIFHNFIRGHLGLAT